VKPNAAATKPARETNTRLFTIGDRAANKAARQGKATLFDGSAGLTSQRAILPKLALRPMVAPSPMTTRISRRTALRSLAGATALVSLPRSRGVAAETAGSGAIRQSVCKWCYRDIKLDEFCAAAKEMGLESVELLNPDEFPTLKKHGLSCAMVSNPTGKTPQGVVVGGIPKAWNRIEHHDTLVALYEKRIAEVAAAGFENVICFSGNRDGLADEKGLEHCALGLKRIMGVAEKHRVTVVMELLNSKVNHKDYMCDRTPWGVELAKRIGSERFKLLYDIYHMQIMEGDVIRTLKENAAYIGHYHTAGPSRRPVSRASSARNSCPSATRSRRCARR
jgi:hydroxypyruvate isomerase